MSQQLICDLCGNRIDEHSSIEARYQVSVKSIKRLVLNYDIIDREYDFCSDCMDKLKKAFKQASIEELRAKEQDGA